MSIHLRRPVLPFLLLAFILILACNLPKNLSPLEPISAPPPTGSIPSGGDLVEPIVEITHNTSPGAPGAGKLVYDVESQCTSAEHRAPYGDSYRINRLERPFRQDMTYLPDLDIETYQVGEDSAWWYVSIDLMGSDPNNTLGINYGVELDQDHDGFGDYIIWAHPTYTTTWDTVNVQIFQDKNHNSSGLSAENADAPIATDGYETLLFNGGAGDADPDLAWVRTNGSTPASVQFAFKKSWAGSVFMLGVLADASSKDVSKLDYVDRYSEAEAGSPIKEKEYYPLKALYGFDNACREAFGFIPTGYEPQLCPRDEPTRQPRTPQPDGPTEDLGCQEPSPPCPYGWAGEPDCYCIPG
jgi:hypothetical protein